jgi:hypothetical protein
MRNGHATTAEYILSQLKSSGTLEDVDAKGRTLFWYVVENRDIALLELMSSMANVNHRDIEGRTPLAEAVR